MKRLVSAVSLVLAGGVLFAAIDANAQTSAASQETLGGPAEYNPVTGSADFDINDFIHRAQMGAIRSPQEFQQDQREGITSAAEAFRQQRMNLLQQQPQTPGNNLPIVPANPAPNPQQP